MVNVGVIGLGTMGLTHLDAYARRRDDVRVVALADPSPDRLAGRTRAARGNIAGQARRGIDAFDAKRYPDPTDLIADPDVRAVDVCLITPLHVEYALAAIRAGKHVLVEKPLARTSAQAAPLVEAAEAAPTIAMCAMCMRFWPGWAWLKQAIDAGTYGRVLAAHFRRMSSHPGGPFYGSGEQSGGAALDLHVHDADFVQYCFGVPESVATVGYSSVTTELDHLATQYRYPAGPAVTAEGSWAMPPGYPFEMRYTVNFERATATFDLARERPLMLFELGKEARAVAIPPGMGYEPEIAYFIDCIRSNRKPATVTLRDAARSIAIVEAEVRSARGGRPERVVPDL